jgi:hypothetical protein
LGDRLHATAIMRWSVLSCQLPVVLEVADDRALTAAVDAVALVMCTCIQDLPKFKRTLLRAQYRVRVLVCSSWFNNFFLLAIILNTVALAIVYDGMTHE